MSFSPYNRQTASYPIRPTPGSTFPRGDPVYEHRDTRPFPQPDNYPELNDQAQPPPSRPERTTYFGDYPVASRDNRGDPWPPGRADPWYNTPRRGASPPPLPPPLPPQHYTHGYYPYNSPPPPPPQPTAAYAHEPPQSIYREDRRGWETPSSDRTFEPSHGWRHSRELSNPRISNILNPASSSPATDDRRWRSNPGPEPTHEYGRPYPQHYPAYSYTPPYYDSRPVYAQPVDNYGQHYYDERVVQARPSQDYRAPPPRTVKKQSAIGDYKRQRQPSQGPYRQLDNAFSESKSVPSTSIPQASRSRDAASYYDTYARYNPPAESAGINSMDSQEAHLDSSEDESEGPSYHSASPTSPRKARQGEGSSSPAKPPSLRRFSPVRDGSSTHLPPGPPSHDHATPSTLQMASPPATSEIATGRQSVMSVHNLIAPTTTKLPTPLSVVMKGLTTTIDKSTQESVVRPSIPEFLPQPLVPEEAPQIIADGTRHVTEPKEVIAPIPIVASVSLSQSLNDAASVEDVVHDIPSSGQSPEPENATALVEDEVPLVPAVEPVPAPESEGGRPVVPQRQQPSWLNLPKPDETMISDTLRKVIVARRNYSMQTREQRVNPVLMANRSIAEALPDKNHASPNELVQEISRKLFVSGGEEQQANVRAALASNFANQKELLAEKTQRLRDEYLNLHKEWLKHCANLDELFKANDMTEVTAVSSRTTRRSAATLGDAVRSDLEMEQIIASLGNEDLTDPNHLAVRNVATIPDMISVERGRLESIFDDTNNFVDDPASFFDPRSGFYDWTPEEERIFYEKYAEYPKQFGIVASFLQNKTAAQCVLYYYIHKKRLIDFRSAANSAANKRKGTRKGRKRKGNALLADIEQTDSQRPAGRGRRRGGGRGRGSGVQPVEESDRPKRRRAAAIAAGPKIVMAKEMEMEDSASVENDQSRDTPLPPKKSIRRGRKSKNATDSPAEASPTPGEPKFIDVNETLGRRKFSVNTNSSHWSEADIADFLELLKRHGKDFKRISASLPSKTVAQVSNYYKNHKKELGLEQIALSAQNSSSSPEESELKEAPSSHQLIDLAQAEASHSQTPTEESQADLASKNKVPPSTEHMWVNEQQLRFQPQASSSHQPALSHQPYLLQPGTFVGPPNARMIIPAHSPIPYAVAMTPGPIGSPVPHGINPRTHTPHGQTEGDIHSGQQSIDARYSSFRAQLPRGAVFINDKRMHIPILPANTPHVMSVRPDGYPYITMHPGAAIRYGPLQSPDQFAHARLTPAAAQRGYPVDPTRSTQLLANGHNSPKTESTQTLPTSSPSNPSPSR